MRKDKARDIARGVLPSTARKGARDNKRHYHHEHRSAQRQANHRIARHLTAVDDDGALYTDVDLFDDFEDRFEFDGYSAASKKEGVGYDDMGYIVDRRRGADKLGPLIRWAEATEKRLMDGWTNEDKYSYFKAILPDTLQGRHALGHIETALRIDNDIFWRFYTPYKPTTKVEFRNALDRCLATKAGRRSLREFIVETVPVAGHTVKTNNTVRSTEPVVDENGNYRYQTIDGRSYRITTDVFIPQTVTVACDDCSFVRNDPLATPEAVKRFAETIWEGRFRYNTVGRRMSYDANPHHFAHEVIDHVLTF